MHGKKDEISVRKRIEKEVREHPLLSIAIAVISTAVSVGLSSTFATVSYVDKEVQATKAYVDDKHTSVKNEIKEIKESVKLSENRIYDLWVARNKP